MAATFLTFVIGLFFTVRFADAQQPQAVIQPGDAIRIEVWRNAELSGEFLVSAEGNIQHPLYLGVNVTGATRTQLTERLARFLERFESNPQFVAIPLLKVGVGGEVRQPNLYRLPMETTIAEAVSLAGGVTERGKLDRVQVIRGEGRRVIDLTNPADGNAGMTINSGDRILIQRRRDILREYIGPVASVLAAVGTFIRIAQ